MLIPLTLMVAVAPSLAPDALSVWQVLPTEPASMAVRVLAPVVEGESSQRSFSIALAPANQEVFKAQPIAIGDEAPQQWFAGTRLPGCMSPYAYHTLRDCLLPGSVVVRSSPNEAEAKTYALGADYLLDEKWGSLGRVGEGSIPPGATVYVDYVAGLERIDAVALLPDGQAVLVTGTPEKVCPKPPALPENAAPLANVYLPFNTTAVTADLVYPIRTNEVAAPGQTPEHKAAAVKNTLAKLRAGGAVTIVFLGDSVTAGGDATKPELRFVDRFGIELRRRFPSATVNVVNAGIGGTNSDLGLERLDKDVLAYDPDLVCIEFVNDMFWPPEKVRENYTALVDRIRARGGEVIIITPHLMMPEWMEKFGPAAQALREAAAERQVGLADVSLAWQNVRLLGIPYQTLLANGINHPDDRGHKIFVDALLSFFPQASRAA